MHTDCHDGVQEKAQKEGTKSCGPVAKEEGDDDGDEEDDEDDPENAEDDDNGNSDSDKEADVGDDNDEEDEFSSGDEEILTKAGEKDLYFKTDLTDINMNVYSSVFDCLYFYTQTCNLFHFFVDTLREKGRKGKKKVAEAVNLDLDIKLFVCGTHNLVQPHVPLLHISVIFAARSLL